MHDWSPRRRGEKMGERNISMSAATDGFTQCLAQHIKNQKLKRICKEAGKCDF